MFKIKRNKVWAIVLTTALAVTSIQATVFAEELTEEFVDEPVEVVTEATVSETVTDSEIEIVGAAAISGTSDKESAPLLEIGKAYTYKYSGTGAKNTFDTDLLLPLPKTNDNYFKYEVTKAGKYEYKFMASNVNYRQALTINLLDSNNENVGKKWVNTNSFTTYYAGPIYLEPGTYYLKCSIGSSDNDGDAVCGNIWFGEYGSTFSNPQYNESEKINDNNCVAVEGQQTAHTAPRIAPEKEYTFSSYNDHDANLAYREHDTVYLYKLLITETAEYKVSFEVTTSAEAKIEFCDPYYEEIIDQPNGRWGNKLKEYTLSLEKGPYYVRLVADDGAKGKIKIAKNGLASGSGDLYDGETKAIVPGLASKDDTLSISKTGKKYIISPTVSANAMTTDTITLLKGNSIYIDPSLSAKKFKSSASKKVAVNKKGKITAEKAGTATITYTVGEQTHQLVVNVASGKCSTRDTSLGKVKGSIASAKVGKNIRLAIQLPMNVSKVTAKNDGVIDNLKVSTQSDSGEIWISGTAAKKGTAKVYLWVNGKKVTVKIKASK